MSALLEHVMSPRGQAVRDRGGHDPHRRLDRGGLDAGRGLAERNARHHHRFRSSQRQWRRQRHLLDQCRRRAATDLPAVAARRVLHHRLPDPGRRADGGRPLAGDGRRRSARSPSRFRWSAPSAGCIARAIPKDESYAVGLGDLVGRVGEVVIGPLDQGPPGRVSVADIHGNRHFVWAVAAPRSSPLPQGTIGPAGRSRRHPLRGGEGRR